MHYIISCEFLALLNYKRDFDNLHCRFIAAGDNMRRCATARDILDAVQLVDYLRKPYPWNVVSLQHMQHNSLQL